MYFRLHSQPPPCDFVILFPPMALRRFKAQKTRNGTSRHKIDYDAQAKAKPTTYLIELCFLSEADRIYRQTGMRYFKYIIPQPDSKT